MGKLDKGYRYQKNGLDFTMMAKDYKVIGKIHYLQAKCNICGKKVEIHQGEWAMETVKICPSCFKLAKKQQPKKKIQEQSKGQPQPVGQRRILIKPKVEIKQPIGNIRDKLIRGFTIDNCKVDSVMGADVVLICQRCNARILLSKSMVQSKVDSKIPLCNCHELEKADVGLIKAVGPSKSKVEQPYRELPGWIFQKTIVEGKKTNYEYRCAICGMIEKFTVNSLLNKDCSCIKCKKISKSKGQPVGSNDWTGFTTKCRRIENTYVNDNNVKMATVKCLLCDETEDIALISVIRDEIQVCDKCASKPLILNCPVCGKNHLKNNLKGLYSGEKSDIICINKNEKIPKEQLVGEHDSRVRMQYIMKKYRGRYTYQSRQGSNGERAELMKFNEGYTGTDGQFYQSCLCVEHNKFLSLTQDEQGTYTHNYCDNDRMIPYNGKRALK